MRRANGLSSAGVQFDSKLRLDRTACAERKHRGPQGRSVHVDVLPSQPRHRGAPVLGQQRPPLSGQNAGPTSPSGHRGRVLCMSCMSVRWRCLTDHYILPPATQGMWIPRAPSTSCRLRESRFSGCRTAPEIAGVPGPEIQYGEIRPSVGLRILRRRPCGGSGSPERSTPGELRRAGAEQCPT